MAIIPHEEICPISEQLLFSLYDAAKRGLPVPVSDVPRERRSSVGLYCYRRSHQNAPADSAESPGGHLVGDRLNGRDTPTSARRCSRPNVAGRLMSRGYGWVAI